MIVVVYSFAVFGFVVMLYLIYLFSIPVSNNEDDD